MRFNEILICPFCNTKFMFKPMTPCCRHCRAPVEEFKDNQTKGNEMQKGFILITSAGFDSMENNPCHSRVSHRSKIYPSRAEAEECAKKYINEKRADRYYICEVIAAVQKVPVQTETIELKTISDSSS